MQEDINGFQERIGYTFNDSSLLECALTHSSYANESKRKIPDNERLEFLGDAVLELVTSTYLFDKYPQKPEGELSAARAALVCETSLDKCARKIGLEEYILLGKGEENTGGRKRPSVVSDAMEAVIGAIYKDRGIDAASGYIHSFILDEADVDSLITDTKSKLQEYTQRHKKGLPEYKIEEFGDKTNEMTFEASVYINGKMISKASGKSKKAAQKEAARLALLKLEVK